ncbi:alpha/beta hydrolase [Aspergillus alliaceus]|uniref:alpha/beta hydrolase n=1 Tax=Petromyces alliaceus TaxID=209559 RepID=UPI0012A71514|nr:uncharacterized protein BDW43DRAFT_301790 [Aspergillus alliaceus]KAB8231339.1 hypothetical protein BDW43DRAFT_301790 [Aspergillus alliaceus]
MASSDRAIVLIGGGWHPTASYEKFQSALEAQDYRTPTADLYTDSEFIRSYVEGLVEAGRHVVVLMHSYGGQVGTNCLVGLGAETRKQRGLTGGVTRLVYIAAFAVTEGSTDAKIAFDFADDDTCESRDPKNLPVGPSHPEEELEAYVAGLARWNGKAMYQGTRQCAWREIPVSFVYATADMTVPFDYQKLFVEKMQGQGREVETFSLDTGPCPTFTKASELVEIVHGVVTRA